MAHKCFILAIQWVSRYPSAVLNILSILIGLVALPIALVGFVPLLGALNWLAIPIAIVGAAIGFLSSQRSGRNFNIFVIIVGCVRLWLGFGIL